MERWGHHIDKVIFSELNLTPNCADKCIYQGIIKDNLMLMARAMDNLLITTTSPIAYSEIVWMFLLHWKVNDMGLVEHYFGLRFIHSPRCVSTFLYQ